MRNEGILKFLFLCTLGLVVAFLLNTFLLRAVRHQYAPTGQAVALFNLSGQIHEWGQYFLHWKDLSDQSEALKNSNLAYVASQARIQSLETENDLLRKSAGLSVRLKRRVLPAGIFDVL